MHIFGGILKLRRRTRRRLKLAGYSLAGAGALILVGVMLVAALGPQTPPPVSDQVSQVYRDGQTRTATPPKEVTSAVFIGDSYVAGDGLGAAKAERWTTIVSSGREWSETNLGAGGTGYVTKSALGPAYTGVLDKVKAANPKVVVVSGGRNDGAADPAALEAGVAEFFTALKTAAPSAKIYAISPLWDSKPYPAKLTTLGATIQASVTSIGGTYIEVGSPLEGKVDAILSDGVHPNKTGHALIAQAVLGKL